MKLSEVLAGCGAEQTAGGRAAGEVTGVTAESRQVKEGDLFVALPGLRNDGAEFIGEAVSRGAVAVVAQRPAPSQVPFFTVGNARQALALIAANFYGKPAEELTLLGVTGTNGKTRSEEHTSELQSRENLVCRLLLEKKKTVINSRANA